MFYSYDILNIRRGKLALAWAAATGGLTVTNKKHKNYRKVMSCVIYKICNDIISHVDCSPVTVDPSKRFSLYLSAMLMGGTVKIYRYQVKYLLETVSEVFMQLMSSSDIQKALIDTTDLSKGVKSKLSEMLFQSTSISFGEPKLDFNLEMEFYPEIQSPRKRIKIDKRTKKTQMVRSVSEDILREDEPLQDTDIDTILKDWPDPAVYPNIASFRDITMIEEPLLTRTLPRELQDPQFTLQPDEGGLLFPPDEFLKPYEPPVLFDQFEKEVDKKAVQKEKTKKKEKPVTAPSTQIEDMDAILPADVAETPSQLTEEKKKSPSPPEERPVTVPSTLVEDMDAIVPVPVLETPLQEIEEKRKSPPRKGAARKLMDDETIIEDVPPEKEADKGSEAEIVLEKIEDYNGRISTGPRRRDKKRRLVFYDEDMQISKAEFQKQLENYSDTLREKTAQEDIVNAHWWKTMKGPQHLLQKTQMHSISVSLKHLIERNYVSTPKDGHFEDLTLTTERPVLDGSVERDFRAKDSELSSLLKISSFTLDSSKATSEKSKHTPRLSHLETVIDTPRPLSSSHPQIPLEAIRPTVLFPSEKLPQEQDTEAIFHSPKVKRSQKVLQPREKASDHLQRVKKIKESKILPDEGFQRASEMHIPLEESGIEKEVMVPPHQVETGRPRSLKKGPSPEPGLQTVVVSVDVHEQESLMEKESTIYPQQIETGRPRALRKGPSPEQGLQTVTIAADVHAQDRGSESERREDLLLGDATFEDVPLQPGTDVDYRKRIRHGEPHLPVGEIESLNLSPIGRPQISRTIKTPDENRQKFELSLFESLKSEKRLTFESLFPEECTRKTVASTFSFLLEQHKRRKLVLKQKENYGTIWICQRKH